MPKPTPIDKEISLNPKRYIVSKTDPKGIIEYGNDYFVEISGYSEAELIGKPQNQQSTKYYGCRQKSGKRRKLLLGYYRI